MLLKNKLIITFFIFFNLFSSTYAAPAAHRESETEIQNAVLFYINQTRQQHGLSKLTMDNRIVVQAKQHSQDMASHRMGFGHQEFGKRISRLRQQIKNTGGGSENVAYNYKNAREVVRNWMLSPGHRRNILGNFNQTGIGVARDKQGRLYYTQIFLQTGHRYAARRSFVSSNPFFSYRRNG